MLGKLKMRDYSKKKLCIELSRLSLHIHDSKMSTSTIFLFVTSSGRAKDAPELVREIVAAGWENIHSLDTKRELCVTSR